MLYIARTCLRNAAQVLTFSSRTLATPSISRISILDLSIFWDMDRKRLCTVWLKEALSPVTINTGHLNSTMFFFSLKM